MARADAVSARPAALASPPISSPQHNRQESRMTQIGEFTKLKAGYSGRIRTLSLDIAVAMVAAEPNETENSPDYRVHADTEDGPEIGAGWKRSSDKAGEFISIQLDDPTFLQPIRANLFQNGDDKTSWSLHWSRPRDRAEKD
ncbi:DUF736 domain-containing protein [Aureimonas sp. SK2]|uniref:DUF736 domain-containing protein n=1 Tax=Aureimonas sp. SK2 TaxID=3015992 RepID=UPI0032608507